MVRSSRQAIDDGNTEAGRVMGPVESVEMRPGEADAGSGWRSADLVRTVAVIVVAAVLLLLLPIIVATEILIFGMFSMATNLLIGTAGLYSFGQAAFFGTGGYAAGYLLAHGATSLPLVLIAAFGTGALVAAAVGLLSIRRVGIY